VRGHEYRHRGTGGLLRYRRRAADVWRQRFQLRVLRSAHGERHNSNPGYVAARSSRADADLRGAVDDRYLAGAGRIAVSSNHDLCLDVQWGNPASGTPVWLWSCNGTGAQQWSYDRAAQTITNTAFGKCLQADPNAVMYAPGTNLGFVLPGAAIAQIGDCVVPTPQWQKWTYDPELGVLHNGLGSVLDIQWNDQEPGATVWLWDENDGSAQQWYADRNSDYCSGLCYPDCSAACANAGPGTGSCVGGCMGSCVGTCMSSATP
jgi:hypothetical protein